MGSLGGCWRRARRLQGNEAGGDGNSKFEIRNWEARGLHLFRISNFQFPISLIRREGELWAVLGVVGGEQGNYREMRREGMEIRNLKFEIRNLKFEIRNWEAGDCIFSEFPVSNFQFPISNFRFPVSFIRREGELREVWGAVGGNEGNYGKFGNLLAEKKAITGGK